MEKDYQINQLIDIALQSVEEKDRAGAVEVLRIMRETFGSDKLNESNDRRQGVRYEMHQSAVIQIVCSDGDVVCLPAVIRNISFSGLMLEIQDKGHVYAGMVDSIVHFSVLFIIPGRDEPVAIDCQPKRMELSRQVRVGAEFTSCPVGIPLM